MQDIYTLRDITVWETMCMAIVIISDGRREKGDVWWFDMLAIYGQLALAFQSGAILANSKGEDL